VTATSGPGAGAESRPEPAASDAEIIVRSQQDGQAFAALFDRHAVAIYRYLARRIGPGTADDLLAQTFLVAFERRGSYDPGRPDAGPWLYGIATNLLRRHHRDEARLYRALTRVAAGAGSRAGGGGDADAMADRVAERVDAGALSHQLATTTPGAPGRTGTPRRS
jgi:RNA polymerase sigma-70 factor (ECF subfamily)